MGIISSIGNALKRSAFGDSTWNAASFGRELKNWRSSSGSADSDNLYEKDLIAERSRDLSRNEPVADAIYSAHAMPTVGSGLRPIPDPDYVALGWTKEQSDKWRRKVKSLMRAYFDSTDADITGQNTFGFMTHQVLVSQMMNGGVVILPMYLESPQRSTKLGTTFQLVEIDQLSNPLGMPDTHHLRGGVEFGDYQRPVALHIQDQHPGDSFMLAGGPPTWTRVPMYTEWGRRQALHVYDPKRIGQSHGIALLAAFMPEFHVLSEYKKAELSATMNNALVAAFVKSNMSSEQIAGMFDSPKDYMEYREKHSPKLEAGATIHMALGDELSAFLPGRPNANYTAFVETVLRQGLASVGLPLESGLRDFSKTNYSSARAALMEAWRVFSTQRQWLVNRFCQPVYELVFEEMVELGMIDDVDHDFLYDNWAALTRAKWIGPGRGWIDETKEADAAGLRMRNRISNLEVECANQGVDWEENLEQLITERNRFAEAGILHPIDIEMTAPDAIQANDDLDLPDTELREPAPFPSTHNGGPPIDDTQGLQP